VQILFSGAIPAEEERRGVTAILGILDAATGEVVHRAEYRTPDALRAPEQKMQFTGYAWDAERLYVCCHNEIVWFDSWPPVEPVGRVSHPGFNDLHHCIPWEGGLLVANTGLETVDHVTLDGELVARWDLLEGVEGARQIDPEREYRLLHDRALKPHTAHGNHVFVRDGDLWVTQLRTSRVVSLTGDERQVEIEAGMPHDGRYIRDQLAFTTTNGHVVLVDPATMEVQASHNLPSMTPNADFLGWCRGICEDPRSKDAFWIAFSYPRATRWREYAFWAKYKHKPLPSRIASYDLATGAVRESYELASNEDMALFQLDLLAEERWL
jgi:hypothetical protein